MLITLYTTTRHHIPITNHKHTCLPLLHLSQNIIPQKEITCTYAYFIFPQNTIPPLPNHRISYMYHFICFATTNYHTSISIHPQNILLLSLHALSTITTTYVQQNILTKFNTFNTACTLTQPSHYGVPLGTVATSTGGVWSGTIRGQGIVLGHNRLAFVRSWQSHIFFFCVCVSVTSLAHSLSLRIYLNFSM